MYDETQVPIPHERARSCDPVDSSRPPGAGSQRELVGARSYEAITALQPLAQGRDQRLPIDLDTMNLLDLLDDVVGVEWSARASKYVLSHIDLRHTFV